MPRPRSTAGLQSILLRQDIQAIAKLAQMRWDGLSLFRPMPPEMSPQEDILRTEATEIVSIGGNRSGKSTILAAFFASVARGIPITTHKGETIDPRLPHQRNKPLELWVVGYDWQHIGHTIYKLLFEPKAYKVIKDATTGLWRAYRPWEQDDLAREKEAVYAPPLIPMSEVKEFAWETKATHEFKRCELKNGNVIYGFASTGEVKAGDAVDLIWVDEKIQSYSHIPEWRARLIDHAGRFMWSTWPFNGNPSLRDMVERAKKNHEEHVQTGKPIDIIAKKSTLTANAYINEKEKRKAIESWGEKEALARDLGEFITEGTQIYPGFHYLVHTAYGEDPSKDDKLAKVLRERRGLPPDDWCCDVAVDPGTTKPGVLLFAIPPKEFWGGFDEPPIVVWNEIYGSSHTADDTANAIWDRSPYRAWQRFVIDGHAARITPTGFNYNVGYHYSEAFRNKGLSCATTGHNFVPGSDDFAARSMEVERLLKVRHDGRPRLRIVTHLCPYLCRQMSDNTKVTHKEKTEERPNKNQLDDLRVCMEYYASLRPTYIRPKPPMPLTKHEEALEAAMAQIDKIFYKPKPVERAHFGRAMG